MKKKHEFEKYSVFYPSWSRRYYLLHPWVWIKDMWINLKNAYMRAVYGFCWLDVWNAGDTFFHIFPQILIYLADNGVGYPGCGEFDTPEKWSDYLRKLGQDLKSLEADPYFEENNQYSKDWERIFENKVDELEHPWLSNEEINKLYFARDRELAEERQAKLDEVGQRFFHIIDSLWD